MLLGARFIRRLVKLENRSPIIVVAETKRPMVQSKPIQGAPKVVTTIESTTPRMVLEWPNKGCPSAKLVPPSRGCAKTSKNLRGDHRGPVHQDQERKKLCDKEWMNVSSKPVSSEPTIAIFPKWLTTSRSAK
jgi:hypothetical protein